MEKMEQMKVETLLNNTPTSLLRHLQTITEEERRKIGEEIREDYYSSHKSKFNLEQQHQLQVLFGFSPKGVVIHPRRLNRSRKQSKNNRPE